MKWISTPGGRLRGAGARPPQLRLYIKWKRPAQPRQANVLERKKGGFPFILSGLFDPEGLGAETRRPLVPQEVARLQ
ncbi:hypothetical protein [Rossellomorea aquimaris]|uniref:hypothetical protein n=1 Tax=Rossellomorea TaxID=2837508 RepID=UPI0016535A4F|nr:hypothetical protein [Rossellomorea aquimaris]